MAVENVADVSAKQARIVFVTETPMTEQELRRAATIYARLYGVRRGKEHRLDFRHLSADELRLFAAEEL